MIPPAAVDALLAREQRHYIARHPRSAALAAEAMFAAWRAQA